MVSTDQYLSHMRGRDRVYDHLKNLGYENTLVFVGHSLQDPDIRHLFHEIGDPHKRPRYYAVIPSVTDAQRRFWENKRTSLLDCSFEDFLITLDSGVSSHFRGLAIETKASEIPIAERFTVVNPELSSECVHFLESDIDYVHSGMQIKDVSPRHFYKGYTSLWSAIDKDLDVRRDIEDQILLNAVLDGEDDNECRVFSIRGHAGSGKSVLLQRVAWQAAHELRKLCLFTHPENPITFDHILELSQVIDERIYLFIDDVNKLPSQTARLIDQASQQSISLTILVAARVNEWNISCQEIDPHVIEDFEVAYLSPVEIDQLLRLLEDHNALFRLEQASYAERRVALEEHAGRQLLVALHEATMGKPFEDIVEDEYKAVEPAIAKEIYLGICFLNRFGVPVRAGLISRVFGIRMSEFKERFFQPLEGLVFVESNRRTSDFVYRSRHPHIAEIVVARALDQVSKKLEMYQRIIGSMNIDYASDRRAYRRLISGRSLLGEFSDHEMTQKVFLATKLRVGDDAHLLHQMAIYEMNRPEGSLEQASEDLNRASSIAPQDKSLTHSLAELHLKMAEKTESPLEYRMHINKSQELAVSLTGVSASSPHGYHTLAKLQITQLEKAMTSSVNQLNGVELSDLIKNAENTIQQGLQMFPDEPYLLTAESDLASMLSDDAKATKALLTAFDSNPRDPFIATRLAKHLASKSQTEDALNVYRLALNSGAPDRHLRYSYARLLIEENVEDGTEIEYQLQRSFADGDSNFKAQFWYARQLYINNKLSEAISRFSHLNRLTLDPTTKRKIRGVIVSNGKDCTFSGRVEQMRYDHGFAIRDGAADRVFLHTKYSNQEDWGQLERDTRISFKIGFNFWGATAINLQLE